MTDRFICIHGHFYQPPRENPWLEAIELQDSAYPYHDWNERISAECYTPNTAARILTANDWISKIINNYAHISFNFGPTLLDWLAASEPDVYQAVIDADRESMQHFDGHGSAFAQCYNHVIMPLANSRDKHTQVLWGLKDFTRRFGRQPEGMWLPETAVDLESLELMAEQGIKFTVLSPYQARRVRHPGNSTWYDVDDKGIDPSMPYQLHLPASGRTISIFFYDGPISRAVAFEKLLSNGEMFAHRLLSGFSEARNRPQLVNIATDGETYGHHHRHGEMALAYSLQYLEHNCLAQVTNYSEFLAKHPPTHEVEIIEGTAWSCAHGVERWQNDCGCNTGMNHHWNQGWRAPLRQALNWLRDELVPRFEAEASKWLNDPWAARNDYIDVILDRSPASLDRFLQRHSKQPLDEAATVSVLKLLELQRHAMLMFTSCGWFFDELSGIETVQVLQYAGRAIQLAEELFELTLEPHFLELLSEAKSNIPEHQDGARIYEKLVKPAKVDLSRVGAHYAISYLFEQYDEQHQIYCYDVERHNDTTLTTGKTKLKLGRARITSRITRESAYISYGAVYFGLHNANGGVREFISPEAYQTMAQEVAGAFNRADLPEVIKLLDRFFEPGVTYSLKELFRDQLRQIMDLILDSTMAELEADYRKIHDRHATLMRFLKCLGIPLPLGLHCATDFYLNTSLRRSFASKEFDQAAINALLDEARTFEIKLDSAGLSYVLEKTLDRNAEKLRANPAELPLLNTLNMLAVIVHSLPFEVDLSQAQNIYYKLLHEVYPQYQDKANGDDPHSRSWVEQFNALGDQLLLQRNS